jgi:hypothetical protein
VTLGQIRSHGCRDLLVYCGSINCSHGPTLNADHRMPVFKLSELERVLVWEQRLELSPPHHLFLKHLFQRHSGTGPIQLW